MKPATHITSTICCLFILAIPCMSLAQADIEFNLDALAEPDYDLSKNFSIQESLHVRINGAPADDCTLFIGDKKVPCLDVQKNQPYLINRRNHQTAFSLYIQNNGKKSASIDIPLYKANAYNISQPLKGGTLVWQDALSLENALKKGKHKAIYDILKKYTGGKDYDYSLFLQNTNVYLQAVLPSNIIDDSAPETLTLNDDGSIRATSGSAGGILDPSIGIDAIGTLIAKRLIDELNMAYLDKFREQLEKSELNEFLPKTTHFLSAIGKTYTFDYKTFLPGLRQNFHEDLDHLPGNGKTFLLDHKAEYLALSKTSIEDYVLLASTLQIIEQIHAKNKPEDILDDFLKIDFKLDAKEQSDVLSWLKFTAIVSNHLRVGMEAGNWIKKSTVKEILSNSRTSYLFIGLLMECEKERLSKLSMKNGNNFYYLLNGDETRAECIKLIYEILELVQEKETLSMLNSINREQSQNDKIKMAVTFVERLLSLIEQLPVQDYGELQKYRDVLQDILSVYEHILQKEYVAAGTILFDLIQLQENQPELYAVFFKYLTFGQSLIDAKTKEELLAVMEDAADPVGSYRQKRTYPMTVSITAFPGIGAGREDYANGVNNNTAINNFGFTAPLGIALSFAGNNEMSDTSRSLTIFASLLDVGSVASLRLRDSSAVLPELSWDNFFAPGLILQYGFKNSPISIFAGAQYGPEARSIDGTTLNSSDRLMRYNAGVSVDLHLYSIYNKPVKSKKAGNKTKSERENKRKKRRNTAPQNN